MQNVKDMHDSWDNVLVKVHWPQNKVLWLYLFERVFLRLPQPGLQKHFQSLLKDALTSWKAPLWCPCFPLLSLTFLHLKIKSTDGQIALFTPSCSGSGLLWNHSFCERDRLFYEVLPVFFSVWSLCDCEAYTACTECTHIGCFVYTCRCLHAVYHDGECSTASVASRGIVTLATIGQQTDKQSHRLNRGKRERSLSCQYWGDLHRLSSQWFTVWRKIYSILADNASQR